MYFLLLQNSDKRKHKREVHFFRHTKVQRRWIQNWMQMKMENIKKWHILAAISNKFLHFLAVPKKIRLLLLLTVILRMSGDCWRTYREQWHLLPDFDAASTEEQISSLVRHFRANQNLFWTRTPLNAENGMSEGGPDCKLFNLKKSSIIAGNETHKFCLLYILYRITRWGGGKSTSIMQSPAAYTLPVKLLTSTNDFLMIGPLSHKAVYSQTVTLTHIHCALHTFAPSRTHTHTHIMSFIKGSTFGLMDHCQCHTHSHYCIVVSFSKMLAISPMSLIFLRHSVWRMNTPNDYVLYLG